MALPLFDLLQHLLYLDISWFISLFTQNIFFLFGFAVAIFFFFQKNRFFWFSLLIVYIWTSLTFASIAGWVLLAAGYLLINYLTRLATSTLVVAIGKEKYLVTVNVFSFIVTLAVYNIFIAGGSF